jgi:hypothetical protein
VGIVLFESHWDTADLVTPSLAANAALLPGRLVARMIMSRSSFQVEGPPTVIESKCLALLRPWRKPYFAKQTTFFVLAGSLRVGHQIEPLSRRRTAVSISAL